MLRIYKQPSIALKRYINTKPIIYQGLRYNSTESNNIPSHKICALPFKLPEEKAYQIVNIASYVNQHAFFGIFKIIKSMFTNKMPDVKESVSSMQVRKAYLPFWYYDMAISADVSPSSSNDESKEAIVKKMGPERQLLGITFDSFWPGHTWDPVCYLSFGQSPATRIGKLVPFTQELCEEDVEILPFTVNPIRDITERASEALENLKVDSLTHKNGQYTIQNANILFNAAYPIYWPVYIAQFTDKESSEELPKTVVIGAHSLDPPLYQWNPKQTGAEQWVNNGPWVQLDVTEPEWHMGFGGQTPLRNLVTKFLAEVVGRFQTNPEIDWEDKRIQSYSSYENQNKEYLKQLFKVWAERNMLTRIEYMDENQKTLGLGRSSNGDSNSTPRLQVKTVSEIRQEIESRVGDELIKLEELEPTWFKEYNEQKQSE